MNRQLKPKVIASVRNSARAFGFEPELDLSISRLFKVRFFRINRRVGSIQLPSNPYRVPFEIETKMATTSLGFSFADGGWHPFVETLKEFEQQKELTYKSCTLFKLYQSFIPENFFQSLFDPCETKPGNLSSWPCYGQLLANIWLLNQTKLNKYLDYLKDRKGLVGWIFYGPHTLEYGNKELKRLTGLYLSVKKKGYNEPKGKEQINGYFLEKNGETRFVILEGNHRLAVLRTLGFEKVKVVIQRGHPTVIRYSELSNWINQNRIVYDLSMAKRIFDHLFYENGQQKASRLGLTKKNSPFANGVGYIDNFD